MSLNRWKVLACTLTIGVGGLAVCAAPPIGKKAVTEPTKTEPVKEAKDKPPASAGSDTPQPVTRQNYNGHVIGLQLPGVPTPELDIPVRATSFGNSDKDTKAKPPVVEVPPAPVKGVEFDIDIPMVPPLSTAKTKADDTTAPPVKPAVVVPESTKPDVLPIPEPSPKPGVLPIPDPMPIPLVITPVKGEEKAKPDAPKKDEPKKPLDIPVVDTAPPPSELIPPVKPSTEPIIPTVPAVKVDPTTPPPAPTITLDPPPLTKPNPTPPTAPPLKIETPSVPPMVLTPPTAPPMAKPEATKLPEPIKGDTAKLKMLLRMGDGKPRFEIRNTQTTELLMKVYGDRIEMQNPPDGKSSLTGVTANGNVRFTAPGIEGTCDQLTILSSTGEVLLKGNIHLKAKFGKTTSEMSAEKMVYQIGAQGLVAPATTRVPVTPARYIQD